MTQRIPDHAIDPLILHRWSPRAFDGRGIAEETLLSLFEAARWAPSAFNYQPWSFLYAHRDDGHWQQFMEPLIEFNQSWVKNAAVLIYILSDTKMQKGPDDEPKPSHSHSFDAGSAWAMLALEATRHDLHAHGMTGVDFDAARKILNVPERLRIEAAIAVGHRADPGILPEGMREREQPSGRKPISEFIRRGVL